MLLPLILAALVTQKRPSHLELGMPKAAVRALYGRALQPSGDGDYSVTSDVDDGRTSHDISLHFSEVTHRLIWIELSLEGQRACDRLIDRMFLRYGKPIEKDLIAEHIWGLWKLKGRPGYVSYTGYYSSHGVTCWKRYL
jgi:hypothetical protein